MEMYEVKGVTQASEIKKAYETAIAENKKYYRTISNTGKIYGWINGKHYIADKDNAVFVNGEYWFENEEYVEPVAEVVDELCEAMQEMVDEVVDEVVDETDYKALYKEEVAVNNEITKELNAVKQELQKVKGEFADYKAIVEAFKKL